jgi:hypothetical protein
MRAASWKSRSVSPPAAWLESADVTFVRADLDVGMVTGRLGGDRR